MDVPFHAAAAAPAAGARKSPAGLPRILIVEDEQDIALLISRDRLLERVWGYERVLNWRSAASLRPRAGGPSARRP